MQCGGTFSCAIALLFALDTLGSVIDIYVTSVEIEMELSYSENVLSFIVLHYCS